MCWMKNLTVTPLPLAGVKSMRTTRATAASGA